MSLILEALKKSEAERRLGKAPGLTTPMPNLHRASSTPSWGVASLLMLIVAAMAASFWWYRQSTMREPLPAEPVAIEQAERGTSMPADAPMASDESDSGADDATPSARSTPAVAATVRGAEHSANPTPGLESARPELPRDPIFDSIEREARAMTAPEDEPTPGANSSDPRVEAPRSEETTAHSVDVAARVDVPRLDQLEADVRSGLPPLKLSMHVFVDEPASRFVLIDGQRYSEGQQIAAQLQLVEIRRDGALLDLSGRHFLLPRP